MAGFVHADEASAAAIAATGHRQAVDAACGHAALLDVVTLRDLRHGTGSLAGGQNDQPSGCRCRQMRPQAALGVRGGYRRAEQPLEKKPCHSIEAQARARLARQNSTSRPLRGWFIMMLAK